MPAAMELLRRCEQYNRHKGELEQIHLRIGLASGDVLSGVFKNSDRMIFTSIGQAVNVAARLESIAEVDSILVEHGHLALCQQLQPKIVEGSSCTFLELKGIPDKIRAYKVERRA